MCGARSVQLFNWGIDKQINNEVWILEDSQMLRIKAAPDVDWGFVLRHIPPKRCIQATVSPLKGPKNARQHLFLHQKNNSCPLHLIHLCRHRLLFNASGVNSQRSELKMKRLLTGGNNCWDGSLWVNLSLWIQLWLTPRLMKPQLSHQRGMSLSCSSWFELLSRRRWLTGANQQIHPTWKWER